MYTFVAYAILVLFTTVGADRPEKLSGRRQASGERSISVSHEASYLQRYIRPHNDFPIDVVYCWAGESMQLDADHSTEVEKNTSHDGFGLNEMVVSIRSLQKYAPWFNKAYLLVNGPAQLPAWAANDSRIVMVDRCSLFPNRNNCPTYNSFACQSVLHRVPGLSEHFINMQDDVFFKRPVAPSNFFSAEGKPLTVPFNSDSLIEMYGPRNQMNGPDMPPEHIPRVLDCRMRWDTRHCQAHGPWSMLRSFAASLEEEYGDWFAFVRSHKHRFKCCNASESGNWWGEEFALMYPAMLHEKRVGVQTPSRLGTYCECWATTCVASCLKDQSVMALNYNAQDVAGWRIVHTLMDQHLKNDRLLASTLK